MESLQTIKTRIASISSTRQITQSMRLVSTSKVQRARSRMDANRPFFQETDRLMKIAAAGLDGGRSRYTGAGGSRAAVVVISGDRGLCGGYNVNINRLALREIRALAEAKIITVGIKARDYLRRRYRDKVVKSFVGISENPFYEDAQEISALVLEWYDKGEIDEVHLLYTKFESMLVHTPVSLRLLPLQLDGIPRDGGIRCEPAGTDFLAGLVPFYLAASVFGAILESSACEQSARITSMDSAVKNSDEMIAKFTLRYNQARQSAITQELNEIVGGANAISE